MYYFGTLKIFSSSAVGLGHIALDEGGKVVLPSSILADLSDYASSESPMMFCITHPITEVLTHCGVLEFSAEEGSMVAPSWVLDLLGLVSGDMVYIESVYPPVGSYARFKPMSSDFLDITNQKAVLENRLRGFSCLTTGDIIPIHYNNKTYSLKIAETRPGDAICIVNCDLVVDFEEPVGYIQPKRDEIEPGGGEKVEPSLPTLVESLSFAGPGYRLDGKTPCFPPSPTLAPKPRGIPDYDWKIGTLTFFRDISPPKLIDKSSSKEFSPFPGSGRSLK